MATDLHVFGPFEVECDESGNVKRVESTSKAAFWAQPQVERLHNKQGCYIFAIRAAKGFVPWYVGRASKGFEQETFTPDKRDKYNRALTRRSKGTPVMFFVALPKAKRKVPARELADMEKELIQFAIARNPDICNIQNTKNSPRWTIKGVIRSPKGKPSKVENVFKTMLRI